MDRDDGDTRMKQSAATLLWSVCHYMQESGSPTLWPQILPFQPVQEISLDEELKSDLHPSSLIFTTNPLLINVRLSSIYTSFQLLNPPLFFADVNLFLLMVSLQPEDCI